MSIKAGGAGKAAVKAKGNASKTGVLRRLGLDEVHVVRELQARESINPDVVKEYRALYQRGVKLPPGVAFQDPQKTIWLADGVHRFMAHEGWETTIELEVRSGTKEDALWFATGANQMHGLHRSSADKRRAVRMALAVHPNFTSARIAAHVGVGDDLVSEIRKSMPASDSDTRVGADGRVVRVIAGANGKGGAVKRATPGMKTAELSGTGVSQTWKQWQNPVAQMCRRPENAGLVAPTPAADEPTDAPWVELWAAGLGPARAIEERRKTVNGMAAGGRSAAAGAGAGPLAADGENVAVESREERESGGGAMAGNAAYELRDGQTPPPGGWPAEKAKPGKNAGQSASREEMELEGLRNEWCGRAEAALDAFVARTPGMAATLDQVANIKAWHEARRRDRTVEEHRADKALMAVLERAAEVSMKNLTALELMAAEPYSVAPAELSPELLAVLAGALGVKVPALPGAEVAA